MRLFCFIFEEMKYFLVILISTLLLFGCGFGEIKLDNLEREEVSYYHLPPKVQDIYINKATHDDSGEWKAIITTDLKDTCKVKFHDSRSYIDLAIHGFSCDIYYKNKTYHIKEPKGNPFVIDEGYFYYPSELNIYEANYKEIKYFKVKLKD